MLSPHLSDPTKTDGSLNVYTGKNISSCASFRSGTTLMFNTPSGFYTGSTFGVVLPVVSLFHTSR